MGWTEQEVPDMKGKIVVVTGGNSGLGYESCRVLHNAGATVIMAARNEEKRADAIAKILKANNSKNSDQLKGYKLDLADLSSVRTFATAVQADFARIDILLNNAGVMALPESKTKDGFETQIGVNHLGHFVLAALLLPLLRKSDNARVVQVSSLFHTLASTIKFDDFKGAANYSKWNVYGQSKLANLLFVAELNRRLEVQGITNVKAYGAHPGFSLTNLQHRVGGIQGFLSHYGGMIIAQSAAKGALPQLYAAVKEDLPRNSYIGPTWMGEMWGSPKHAKRSAAAKDEALAKQLWDKSEEVTGVKFEFDVGQ
eukprot:TRINITY_DN4604_c0_g1_i1.p1 TRINITY_DN4604_c0_g1~~TRINITY_DN4604_c0_g1_i1.p1  ORF type:complete len:312 (+),score=75.16 TRINITY_DN4604_c0_g1_i1:112-1047(+)